MPMGQENVALEEPGGGSFKYQVRKFVQGHTGSSTFPCDTLTWRKRLPAKTTNCIFLCNFRHFLSITDDLSEKGF